MIGAACSSFDDADTTSPSTPDDASISDAPSNDDATSGNDDAASDAGALDAADAFSGENLLLNGDFEANGCAGWSAINAGSSYTADGGREGGACVYCSNTADAGWTIYGEAPTAPLAGERYAATAWVRKAGDGGNAAVSARIGVRNASGLTLEQSTSSSGPTLDGTWQRVDAVIDVTVDAGATKMMFTLQSTTIPACLAIDDAVLYRTK